MIANSNSFVEADPSPPSRSSVPTQKEAPLSLAQTRRLLAQIVHANLLDCFDDSGAFDLDRARRTLPAVAVQHLTIDETTKTDRHGTTTTRRRIRLRLVDKVRALKLSEQLERLAEERSKQEKPAKPRPIRPAFKPGMVYYNANCERLSEERARRGHYAEARRKGELCEPEEEPPPCPASSAEGEAHHEAERQIRLQAKARDDQERRQEAHRRAQELAANAASFSASSQTSLSRPPSG